MIETRRLITPTDDFRTAFPGLNFRNRRSLATTGEKVLLVDPIYIADVYNSTDDVASFLRDQGLFLMDFGGGHDCPGLVEAAVPAHADFNAPGESERAIGCRGSH